MNWFALLCVFIGIAVVAVRAHAKSKGADIAIAPAPQRADLLYGYYGCYGNQVQETAGHTNLLFENVWQGLEKAIENMRAANTPTVIDLAAQLFSDYGPLPRSMRPDAQVRVRAVFDAMQRAGVLHLVRIIVPADEPNLPESGSIGLMPEAVALIRSVAADYPELASVKLGVIYFSDKPMEHIGLFDIVGFDAYEERSSIFAPGGLYEQMRARLRPDQRTWIIPGACYGQDPQPFLNYANANAEVLAIVPFLWCTVPWETAFKGIVEQPERRAAYTALGTRIVSARG